MFPGGLAGGALLLLRLCAASILLGAIFEAGTPAAAPVKVLFLLLISVMLLSGFLTPVACVLSLALQATTIWALHGPAFMDAELHMVMTISLLLLGPGAYSIDARLFGRRLILPPSRTP